MPKKRIPKDKKTITVSEYFRIRGDYPSNLRLRLRDNGYWQAEYLPEIEDDIRPNQGRSKSGKRLTIRASMETKDPDVAAKKAIEWINEKKRSDLQIKKEEIGFGNNLEYYWKEYYENEQKERVQTSRTFKKWQRDELLKWTSETYGISNQEWSKIGVDKINDFHIEDYFKTLKEGMKAQQKTLLNKLFKNAKKDMPDNIFPTFPEIKKSQSDQVVHIRKNDWETLLKGINVLSEKNAEKILSIDEYENLPFKKHRLDNPRNWVDLHDALLVEWFFYLRAEDMPRLRVEWFNEIKDEDGTEIQVDLEETKGDRDKHTSTHYRPEAVENWKRISARRNKKGWLICPTVKRTQEGGGEYSVQKRLNTLLKRAIKNLLPEYADKSISWTNIRHTAFRLTLEDCPELGQTGTPITEFARNGFTSPEELYETYLKYIDSESQARKTRKKIKPMEYTLVRNKD